MEEWSRCTYFKKEEYSEDDTLGLTSSDLRMASSTLRYTRKADSKYKVAATLWIKGRMVAYGVSSRKTHPIHYRAFPEVKLYLHAETDLLRKVGKIPKGSTLVVIRSNKDGSMASDSFPCDYCIRLIERRVEGYAFLVFTDRGRLVKVRVCNSL